jgi:hypothetical protein
VLWAGETLEEVRGIKNLWVEEEEFLELNKVEREGLAEKANFEQGHKKVRGLVQRLSGKAYSQ